ncbi:hypothetical protein Tco_1401204 [Tanacetum coccineum]
MHIRNDPSFFFTNNTRAPHGDELGRIKPFSNNSCSCLDNSFILDGAKRYGARATGAAPALLRLFSLAMAAHGGRNNIVSRRVIDDLIDISRERSPPNWKLLDKMADFNKLIAVVEEKIHGKEIDLEICPLNGAPLYLSVRGVRVCLTWVWFLFSCSELIDGMAFALVKSAAAKMARSKSVYQHTMKQGGYALVKEKMKRNKGQIKEGKTLEVDSWQLDAMIVLLDVQTEGMVTKTEESVGLHMVGAVAVQCNSIDTTNNVSLVDINPINSSAGDEGKTTIFGCENDASIQKSNGLATLEKEMKTRSAKKQQSVAMSSAEAEYVAVVGCYANILWMKSQFTDYDIIYEKVPIFCDNTSAIAISNNTVLYTRTKHIDIIYHVIRDYILKGDIELHFIPTQYQLADIFTKTLDEPTFKRLIVELGKVRGEIGITTFRNAVRVQYLPHSSMYVPLSSITTVRPWFTTIGYNGEIGAKGTLNKSCLSPRWRLLMG